MTDLHYDERLNILGLMRLDKRRDNWVHNRSFDYPSILLAITSLLTANSYFIVIALDFSKAFDTVRHSAVLQKLAQLDIPDHIFNWISDHSHCTMYNNYSSDLRTVSASIIQGSGVGPSLYVVEASDLNTVTTPARATYFANMPTILTLFFLPVIPIHD